MLIWAIGFFLAASLVAFVAFQAGGSLPDVIQIMFWVLTPILVLTLLKPIFHRKVAPVLLPPIPPRAGKPRQAAVTAVLPKPRGKQHTIGSRLAAFVVNAGIAMLFYTWLNNELKAQRDMDAYNARAAPFDATFDATLTGEGFDGRDSDPR